MSIVCSEHRTFVVTKVSISGRRVRLIARKGKNQMKENMHPRVRFAPSPTGPLHIGGVRTALYNYLFARHFGGTMILRIEDTDSKRYVPGAEAYIIEALDWLGIEIDEGVGKGGPHEPYRQSERRDIYRKYVTELLNAGKAYKAYDTAEELEAKRKEIPNFQYDASTRLSMKNSLALSPEACQKLEDAGVPYVVRFKIEPGRDVEVDDLIRGKVCINSSILDDKVLYKQSDDLPTYHLANIVDDHLMEVTHVIRGEEWLPSSPLHKLLYEAFGWEMPRFAHLSLLLKPEGNGKLSKRDGDRLGFPVFPLEWHDPVSGAISSGYRESGYLPEAVLNFLALLGWNPGDGREEMNLRELTEAFTLKRCSKSGAKFDFEKGKWFNHLYIQQLPSKELAEILRFQLAKAGIAEGNINTEAVVQSVKDRVKLLPEMLGEARFFYEAPDTYDAKAVKKRWKADTPTLMHDAIETLKAISGFESEPIETALEEMINAKGYSMGAVMNAMRLALVGALSGPHLADILAILGKEESVRRIERAVESIKL